MRGPLGTVIPFQHNPIHPFRGSEKKVEFLALVWVSAVANNLNYLKKVVGVPKGWKL